MTNQRIQLVPSHSTSAGSCTYCNRHQDPKTSRTIPHEVTILRSNNPHGSILTRMCNLCRKDLLKELLADALPDETTP